MVVKRASWICSRLTVVERLDAERQSSLYARKVFGQRQRSIFSGQNARFAITATSSGHVDIAMKRSATVAKRTPSYDDLSKRESLNALHSLRFSR
jgi:hypothetical protein